MADAGGNDVVPRGDARPALCKNAIRALQFGLLSLVFLFATLATFGPWFSLPLGYVLTGASMASGLGGLVLAHDASHRLWKAPSEAGRAYARLGAAASLAAVLVSGYLSGLLSVLLLPLAIPIWTTLLYLFAALHWGAYARRGRPDSLPSRASPVRCWRCGRPSPPEQVWWTGSMGWCDDCIRDGGGVPT